MIRYRKYWLCVTSTLSLSWYATILTIIPPLATIVQYANSLDLQYSSLLNWRKKRFCCGFVAVPVNWILSLFHYVFAIFENVVNSLEPGETPSNSASHQAPNYVQHSSISRNTLKRCVAVAVRLRYFFNLLKTSTV